MLKRVLLQGTILFSYYILGAYATTDILRLTKGSELPLWDSSCRCPGCGKVIPLSGQIPILSYFFSKGRCTSCGMRIPKDELRLESIIFLAGCITSFLIGFSFFGLFFMATFYEMVKVFYICLRRPREKDLAKNVIYSLAMNLLIFCLIAFPCFLLSIAN